MAWMRSVKKYQTNMTLRSLKAPIERIRTAINHMEQSNFPQGVKWPVVK